MAIAAKIRNFVDNGSMIRKMFEEGARLKALHGADKVFDFSIGNPNVPPPAEFEEALAAVVSAKAAGIHAYMPNAGLPEARAAIASLVSAEHGVEVDAKHVALTCGAAGALNIVFKTLLEPGDEVLVSAPYFVEYGFIADNHGGVLKTVPSTPDFSLDIDAIQSAITARTKIVLVNTPNNPTGKIYSAESLRLLASAIAAAGEKFGRTIYLVSDEPYRRLAYDGALVPSPLASYRNSILVTSFSKDLSLPGERIGYVAVNPGAEDLEYLMGGLSLSNRILGFVNAPSLMQHVIAELFSKPGKRPSVDVEIYQRKRDMLSAGLASAGYEFGIPEGAFYLFVKTPGGGDDAFLERLKRENILVVPGKAFGTPGFFRIAYCVDDATIAGSMEGFRKAMESFRKSAASGLPNSVAP